MMTSKLLQRLFLSTRNKLISRSIAVSSAKCQKTLRELDIPTYSDSLNNIAKVDVGATSNGIGVWLEAGSRFENADNNGAANFADRLWFKGTANRSETDIENEVEKLGAVINSYVRRDESAIFVKCHSKDAEKVLELISDLLLKPAWDEQHVDQARKDITNELTELESHPKAMVMDYLHATAYQGTPLAFSVYGPESNVEKIGLKDVKRFYEDQIKAPRTVVSAVGGVDHQRISDLVSKYFGDMTISYENEIPLYDQQTRFTGSELRHRHDDYPLCVGALAIETPPINSPDTIALQIAAHVIGSWDMTHPSSHNLASRLAAHCTKGSLEEGSCHSFEHFMVNYRETGLWGAYFTMNNLQPLHFVGRLQTEWMRLCTSVTEAEVERAKNFMRTDLFSKYHSSQYAAATNARQLQMLDRIIPPAELEARINSVTAKTVHDVCMRYIYDTCPAVANYGQVEAFPDYVITRSYMWQFRI